MLFEATGCGDANDPGGTQNLIFPSFQTQGAFEKRASAFLAVSTLAALLAGCAGASLSGEDAVLAMYVDPSRYNLYNCAQLRTAKREQAKRVSDIEALMAKAQTGAGGAVMSEVAYRNDYNNARANYNLAEKAWQKNKCDSERLPAEKLPPAGASPSVSSAPAPTFPETNEQLRQVDRMYQAPPVR